MSAALARAVGARPLYLAFPLRSLDALALPLEHDFALKLPDGAKDVDDEFASWRRSVICETPDPSGW